MGFGKQMGLSLRFIYGYLKGFILVSIVYMAVALTVIFFDPQAFSLYVIQYIKTAEYSKLRITWIGQGFMILYGIVEWLKCKNEIRRKKRRKKRYE